ncbi:Carbon starvation protein CstA [Caloranaerobacter azorensis DSM 13643]|uniref:Carbon starvation protein CstA n=1 Tax=Caloranaerobacter azorensis DSM 13643 TaxID=1121264 RepID=A0A1M5URV2_9FIRM|nr:carbon starvation protein A [Caloranaerobacter azorensis]SHH65701.1 Carbon starvation protein CstA [Caloranaerobacter azorensis DSM 13643]
MVSFLTSILILVLGYFTYGKFVEKVFGVDEKRPTPAVAMNDGVDFVQLSWPKIFLIQFLNIAGLGPIFGAIMGALFGPAAFLWIVLGSIFAGAVHDYFSGMLSVRHDGKSISEIVGIYLGEKARKIMRIFSVILLVLVGTVFMTGPAKLLASLNLVGINSTSVWLGIIIIYYFLATILPVDKVIGRIYPLFGAALLIMAVGIGGMLVIKGYNIPEIALINLHPKGLPIWPMLFVTIACGAISGFHATQSPMMARCISNEKYGRRIFYGAMISEGIIALIWAAAAMSFFDGGILGLNETLANGGPGAVVKIISSTLLGPIGGVLAMLGVIAAPITSGDTAFRSARLVIADALGFKQSEIKKRLMLAIPLFAVGFTLTRIDFGIIWRYFAWSNQTLAMIVLWASAAYLMINKKIHWIATIPATFMTAVSVTYILQAPEGFRLPTTISYPVGIIVAVIALVIFITKFKSAKRLESEAEA